MTLEIWVKVCFTRNLLYAPCALSLLSADPFPVFSYSQNFPALGFLSACFAVSVYLFALLSQGPKRVTRRMQVNRSVISHQRIL